MRICIVSDLYYPYTGGISEHVYQLYKWLKIFGHEVKILTTNYFGKQSNKLSQELSIVEEDTIRVGIGIPYYLNNSVCFFPMGFDLNKKIKKVMEDVFDVVHFHGPHIWLGIWASQYSKGINIATCHSGMELGSWHKPLSKILYRFTKNAHAGIAVSEDAVEIIRRFISCPYKIIPNGVDIGRFSPKVLPLEKFKDGKLNILFVGRLDRRKGLKYLLSAFPIIKKEIPNARLIIVGRSLFKEYKGERGKDILFEGHFSRNSEKDLLPRYYASCDVFCSPAIGGESFGMVLLEAMATGKPVVASNIPGYNKVIENGKNGILVKPCEPSALAKAIIEVIKNDELRKKLSENGYNTAVKYSWDKIVKQIESFYYEIKNNFCGLNKKLYVSYKTYNSNKI